jgi:hypothetical protein
MPDCRATAAAGDRKLHIEKAEGRSGAPTYVFMWRRSCTSSPQVQTRGVLAGESRFPVPSRFSTGPSRPVYFYRPFVPSRFPSFGGTCSRFTRFSDIHRNIDHSPFHTASSWKIRGLLTLMLHPHKI